MTKRIIDPTLATLRGYDLEMDRKIQEAVENLARTRDCVLSQAQAEPRVTKQMMIELMRSEIQIYKDFANDIIRIANQIDEAMDEAIVKDQDAPVHEVELTYPSRFRKCGNSEAAPKRRPGRPRKAL